MRTVTVRRPNAASADPVFGWLADTQNLRWAPGVLAEHTDSAASGAGAIPVVTTASPQVTDETGGHGD